MQLGLLLGESLQNMGTVSSQILSTMLILFLLICTVSGQNEGDVQLVDGPNDYEGRPEIFNDGAWRSICYSFTNSYIAGTICKQLGYQPERAIRYIANSYGKAPGEIFGQQIYCYLSSSRVSKCSMNVMKNTCDPRYTLGISCNTTTSEKTIRLKGAKTQYEGRIEIFENGVWGTVCRNDFSYSTYIYRDINAHIACRELFGSSYGGMYFPIHETPDRFGILQSGAIQRSYVKCKGNEDSLLHCSFSRGQTDTSCNHEMDATVKCFKVPDGCVGYTKNGTGSVRSPGYPAGHYFTEDTVCVWKIEVASGRKLKLSFSDINAHNQIGRSSYIQVSQKGDQNWMISYGSPLPDLISEYNTAFIRHKHRAGTFGIDFAASWTQDCNFSYIDPWSVSYTIKSPGYDDGNYPPGLDCYYAVQFRKKVLAHVWFHSFHLDDKSSSTCQDYIEIFDGPTVSDTSLGRFCGSSLPSSLTLTQNMALLHFHSDYVTDATSTGVQLNVYGREREQINNVTGSSGVLNSPGYPNLYADETDYKWIISALPYQSITLVVSDYNSSTCHAEESLQLNYMGDQGYRRTASVYCRPQTSAVFVSNGNRMEILFKSVFNISIGHAFLASWTAACRRTFTSTSGKIMSAESPLPYPADLDCVYIITLQTGYYIKLNFTSFNLDFANPCNDYVQIRDGISEDFPLLTVPLCGASLPPAVKSSSNSLLIQFHTDSLTSSTSSGFVATYTSQIKECASKKMTSRAGVFASPGYPVQHAVYTNCVWTITVPSGIVQLTFKEFAVGQKNTYDCSGAYVRIYDGDGVDASTVIETLCGSIVVPKITSTGRSLTVSLFSFGSLPSSSIGFQASYKSVLGSKTEQYALFPYGKSEQDLELQHAFAKVSVKIGFPFQNKIENEVYIGNNGLVSIGNPYSRPDLPETGKVICVYCAFIDNSDSVGGIYYHQYTSDEPADASVLTKASGEVQEFAETSSFNAHYVMVVTWDRVKQGRYITVNYDPDDGIGEATFQLALISDGEMTYALVYYKLGRMTWTYRGSWTYVIIGLSSGDRENYRLNLYTRTKRAYRIDAVPGNTGRLGTWFYKIGTVSGTPEGTCTTWFSRNIKHSEIRNVFFSRLPECPCSHRDVWQKTRYLWVRARVDNIRQIECYRMNRASSNRFYPVGKECCYSLDRADSNYEQLIMSRPNAGSALAYNPSYCHFLELYQKEDKSAHASCCNISVSYPVFCKFYYLLRPVGKCRSDIPFRYSSQTPCDIYRLSYPDLCRGKVCQVIQGEPTCICLPGFKESSTLYTTCVDVDECMENTHSCDQVCTNTLGSFSCSCNSGYVLDSDGRTCNGLYDVCDFYRTLYPNLCDGKVCQLNQGEPTCT
ncbi:scavenger receptor cysteine-rich domain-containing protein DMBT1-like [Littorina saxatilis]|uniref:scavenger receptor cysteine-rich domain-containing protein DMBT1-like n=1 Tax=Littorina saxatilis TaxID=31220 RepID=UPI0038B49F86